MDVSEQEQRKSEARGLFSPREFKGGRVKVYGCSPGCLAVSLALSLFLTLAVNACIRLVG
jgi:hypothetical protein